MDEREKISRQRTALASRRTLRPSSPLHQSLRAIGDRDSLCIHHDFHHELSFHGKNQTHQLARVKRKKLQVLPLFDAISPTTLDQDLGPELKTADWKTEANLL